MFLDLRMWHNDTPADVREKETAIRIMRISVCVCVSVVESMVPSPIVQTVLNTQRLECHQNET